MKKILVSLLLCFILSNLSYASQVKNIIFDEEEFLIDALWNEVLSVPDEKIPKIALVLGGGGARGFAHIGVFKVIEQEGIPVDLVVGTSIGSIAGAFYCAGIPLSKIEDLAKDIKWSTISNFGIPSLFSMVFSEKLMSNKKIENFLNTNIGDLRFDELKIPLICVATDLNTGERIVLREGSVAFAARASSTLPGIFEPVEYRQRYLVDGGLSENVPINVARVFNPDIIIAVAVSADITKNTTSSVFATLLQAIYIQGTVIDQENLEYADVIIRPEVGEMHAADIGNAYKTINRGFIAAKKSLKEVKIIIINKTQEKHYIENQNK